MLGPGPKKADLLGNHMLRYNNYQGSELAEYVAHGWPFEPSMNDGLAQKVSVSHLLPVSFFLFSAPAQLIIYRPGVLPAQPRGWSDPEELLIFLVFVLIPSCFYSPVQPPVRCVNCSIIIKSTLTKAQEENRKPKR